MCLFQRFFDLHRATVRLFRKFDIFEYLWIPSEMRLHHIQITFGYLHHEYESEGNSTSSDLLNTFGYLWINSLHQLLSLFTDFSCDHLCQPQCPERPSWHLTPCNCHNVNKNATVTVCHNLCPAASLCLASLPAHALF